MNSVLPSYMMRKTCQRLHYVAAAWPKSGTAAFDAGFFSSSSNSIDCEAALLRTSMGLPQHHHHAD
jgi:hypothetical protein